MGTFGAAYEEARMCGLYKAYKGEGRGRQQGIG